jgi:hypothetical protein
MTRVDFPELLIGLLLLAGLAWALYNRMHSGEGTR